VGRNQATIDPEERLAALRKDAERKARERFLQRDLVIPKIKEPSRRADCLADIKLFHKTYFPTVFYQPFTIDREEVINAIEHCCRFGGDQAVVAYRGDGKTRIALFTTLRMMLAGALLFPMIVSKSGDRAVRELQNLKDGIEESRTFLDDFPEVAFPIKALGRWASKARQQTAYSELTNMEWASDVIVLPTIPSESLWANGWNEGVESAARGQIFASLGWEGPIRGYSIRNRRPDLAIIDDIDDRESAGSPTLTAARVLVVEQDIAGLGGPDRNVSRLLLGTLQNNTCVAAIYSDRAQKRSFHGLRYKLLETYPTNMGLWEEYIELRRNRSDDDRDARVAHQHYLANREAMDVGASVINPHRFDSRNLEDGSQAEVSALQACFNIIADRGQKHFDTEYQNDPKDEDTGIIKSGLTPGLIQRQLNGKPFRVIPDGCTLLTHSMDMGKTKGCNWVVRAWEPNGNSHIIDYNVLQLHGVKYASDEGLERALYNAVLRRMDEFRATRYAFASGDPLEATISTFDCRWQTDAILSAVKKCGMDVFGIQGIGRSAGAVKGSFRDVIENSHTRRKCGTTGAYEELHEGPYGKLWAIHANADKWKTFEHERWLTAQDMPGCAFLYGEKSDQPGRLSTDERAHQVIANHICSEMEYQDGQERKWPKKPTGDNDYLDCLWHTCCAAAMRGIRVLGVAATTKPKIKLSELYKQKRGGR
jgi:hypothetical protein